MGTDDLEHLSSSFVCTCLAFLCRHNHLGFNLSSSAEIPEQRDKRPLLS